MLRVWAVIIAGLSAGLAACTGPSEAPDIRVAVASNFLPVMAKLEAGFEADTGYQLQTVSGSTGALYTQITQGAPYDIFLAADAARPQRLEADGSAVQGSRITYALGGLVLWSNNDAALSGASLQQTSARNKFAIANPNLAPYGRAAREVLISEGVYEALSDRLVYGENISQTFAFIQTGNAALGFIAKAQLLSLDPQSQGAHWTPPASAYEPIRQDAVLLTSAADNPAAKAFMAYLKSDKAGELIATHGYERP